MRCSAERLPGLAMGALLAASLWGCAGRPLADAPLSPPLDPAPSSAGLAAEWYFAWEAQEDILAASGPQSMLLIASGEGREWRSPPGPDGYVVRVVLLDDEGRPTRADGEFQAFVVRQPAGPEPEPLLAWSVTEDQAAERYRQGITAGYLLELDWGPMVRPVPGHKMLVVRWLGPKQQRITRNVAFDDRMEYGIQTTTERP